MQKMLFKNPRRPKPEPPPPAWIRLGDIIGDPKFATHLHSASGWTVKHCGHPTANYPYYCVSPAGRTLIAPNGRGFTLLKLAKAAAEAAATETQCD